MKVLVSWLRDFVELPKDARAIGDALTSAGLAVDGIEERAGGDAVLDLDVTTNRVDCMNVYGVAREAAVRFGVPLRAPATDFTEKGAPAAEAWAIDVLAADLCPRFCGRVLDVRVGPSPEWMRARLEAAGVRPINNVVDLTNYAMLELGHPSHAFDLAKIPGARLGVRWARAGERVTTLDGQDRALLPAIGVIAGGDGRPLSLAGIMGGASSEVSGTTRTVALEAAYWDPLSIRRAAKALGMHTEASHRFERGADPEAAPFALARIAHLAEKIGAGTTRPGLVDRNVRPLPRRGFTFRPARATALLGAPVEGADARRILAGLGFTVRGHDEALELEAPSWRGDVSREVDAIEEVGRHLGLQRIPSTIPPAGSAEGLRPRQKRDRAIRDVLAGAGLTEAVTYSFVAAGGPVPSGPALQNPLSEDQKVLRGSLVGPGLLSVLRTNLRQARTDVRLFEVGRVFTPEGGESERVAFLLAGSAVPLTPAERPRPTDFADAKGVLEILAARLGLGDVEVDRAGAPGFLHPGQSGVVRIGGASVGYVGALDPARAEAWEARGPVFVAEIEVAALPAAETVRVAALPRFPAVERDLSVLCDAGDAASEVEKVILGAAGERLRAVAVAARFDKPPVPPGKVSLTFRLTFQDPARTLTGEEVQSAMDAVAAALKASGRDIRGE